jgi:hypothetical protein
MIDKPGEVDVERRQPSLQLKIFDNGFIHDISLSMFYLKRTELFTTKARNDENTKKKYSFRASLISRFRGC